MVRTMLSRGDDVGIVNFLCDTLWKRLVFVPQASNATFIDGAAMASSRSRARFDRFKFFRHEASRSSS